VNVHNIVIIIKNSYKSDSIECFYNLNSSKEIITKIIINNMCSVDCIIHNKN